MISVYLDQNKWIDLAKAEAGKPDAERFNSVLAAIRRAVQENRACFPLSFPHMHETARAPRPDQRVRLARLMAEFSGGFVLRTPQEVIENCLKHSVREAFREPPISDDFSPFGRGIEAAVNFNLNKTFGISSGQAEKMRRSLDSPDTWIDLLSHNLEDARKTTIARLNAIGDQAAIAHDDDRELLEDSDEEELRRVFATRTTLHFRGPLERALSEIGRTLEEWGSLGPDALVKFWFEIPCVCAQLELEIGLHRNKSRHWSRNDLADLNFLGLAIPFCDVVVTEKLWVELAKQRRLNQKFKAALLSDLEELKDYLNE